MNLNKTHSMRIVPYIQGIGRYEKIEVIYSGLSNEFNEMLEAKLSTGWRLVQEINTMNKDYWWAVVAISREAPADG